MAQLQRTMTLKDKGEIFHLIELGKNIKEISKITNFPEDWLKFTIEGCKDTNAWFDAIAIWEENKDDEKRHLKNRAKTPKSSRRFRNKIWAPSSKTVGSGPIIPDLSRFGTGTHKNKSQSTWLHRSSSKVNDTDGIVKILRKSKDYVGEDTIDKDKNV
jgi:hypothetical protein